MTQRPRRPNDPPWEMPEFMPPHALEDVPWDRPAEHGWMAPDPDLDALTWNERWNKAAYDPDYPLPPEVARVPRAMAAAAAGSAPRARFGRPVRSPEDVELEDPYDEYAPLADDLQAPGQLAWTAGTVPLYAAASVNGSPSHEPSRPHVEPSASPLPVEPPMWSRSSRSVFGDYFAPSGGPVPSLPSPDSASASRAMGPITRPQRKPELTDGAGEEWPPVPTDFRPQWASVTPVRPLWSEGSVPVKAADTPEAPPTWVQSTPAPAPLDPPIAAAATATTTGSLPASRPLPPVRPVIPAKITPRPPAPILPDDYDPPVAIATDASAEGDGPSTAVTLFWMAVTGIVVVGLVLAFLHFLTGVFR